MKTKITNISPDQNIIEHESGLKTVFVPLNAISRCANCVYCKKKEAVVFYCGGDDSLIQCGADARSDKQNGYFKLLEQ